MKFSRNESGPKYLLGKGKHFSCLQNDIQAPSFLPCKVYGKGLKNKTYSKHGLL